MQQKAKQPRNRQVVRDRRGKTAPVVAVAAFRQIGPFWKLVDRHGVVGISRDGETVAVCISCDHFVSLLFGISQNTGRKRGKTRSRTRARRRR